MRMLGVPLLALVPILMGNVSPRAVVVVTGLRGTVELKRGHDKEFSSITSTTVLAVGDRLRLAKGASATLLREDAAPAALKGERTVRIEARSGKAAESKPSHPLHRINAVLTASAKTAPMAIRTVRREDNEEPPLLILTPRYSSALDGMPTIAWTKVTGAQTYAVTVLNAGQEPVFNATTTEASLTLSADQSLMPGVYSLEVATTDASGKRLADTVRFTVVAKDEAATIREALHAGRATSLPAGTPCLPLLCTLIHYVQLPEAETELRAVVAKFPEDQTLRLLLADVYRLLRRPIAQFRELKAAGIAPVIAASTER